MERMEIENCLTIQDVSIQLQVPKSTLRYWEQAFGSLIEPVRTRGGQRRYGQAQVDLFQQIVQLKKMGKKIAQIKYILREKSAMYTGNHIGAEGSVELLARRIAGIVNEEVKRFFASNGIVKL